MKTNSHIPPSLFRLIFRDHPCYDFPVPKNPFENEPLLGREKLKGMRKIYCYRIVTTVLLKIYTVLRTMRIERLPLLVHLL